MLLKTFMMEFFVSYTAIKLILRNFDHAVYRMYSRNATLCTVVMMVVDRPRWRKRGGKNHPSPHLAYISKLFPPAVHKRALIRLPTLTTCRKPNISKTLLCRPTTLHYLALIVHSEATTTTTTTLLYY